MQWNSSKFDDIEYRQGKLQLTIDKKYDEMGNTIKDWDVRLQEIEGRMHENTTLVQRVNTSFRSLESSMQTLITQARQINMQSQDLSIQVKQDITDQQLKIDDRIRHLEIIPSKITYIENLIEDEF